MPRPLTAAGRAALEARELAFVYLFEIITDEGAQRINTWSTDLSYDGEVWGAAPDQWKLPTGIPISKALVPETFSLEFDGGLEDLSGFFIGQLLQRTWHQRPVRFFGLVLNLSDLSVIDTFYEWRGKCDRIVVQSNAGRPALIQVHCESGVFRAQEANDSRVAHNDQVRRDATDTFFKDMAVKQNQQVPYGISWSKVPGYSPTTTTDYSIYDYDGFTGF